MRRITYLFALLLTLHFAVLQTARATEMYFTPDTAYADLGDTVLFSANITASDTVRSFTVYMTYDTNDFDLVIPPIAGVLIASLPGLDFRYSDHIVAAPDWLEVGATIFGNSFWSGPGELFQFGVVVRECGVFPMAGSFGLRRPDGTYIPCTFNPPALLTCGAPPSKPDSLTIFWSGIGADLRWKAVTEDTFGEVLAGPVTYYIYRADELMTYTVIDSTFATTYFDDTASGDQHYYYVTAVVSP